MRAVAPLLLAALGCADEPEDSDTGVETDTAPLTCTDLALVVEIGTGASVFAPLADGDEVVMVHGPQGGWHVDVSARVDNAHQTVILSPRITLDATGEQIAGDQQDAYVALAGYDGCGGEVWGQRCYVDDHDPTDQDFICSLAGQRATIAVEVTDAESGRTILAEKPVTLTSDPNDPCP